MRLSYFLVIIMMWIGTLPLASAQSTGQKPFIISEQALPLVVYGNMQLQNEINAIVNTDASAVVAVYVKSMKYSDALYARNAHYPLIPASILKVMTAEAALIYLGPTYRFSTQLLTDAKTVKRGILQGNLYVVLSGDPTLTFNDLVDLMNNLKTNQIEGISGDIIIDQSAYDQNFYGPGWDGKDKAYCYAAPISASIINHNCLPFKVSPTQTGHKAQVITSTNYFYPSIKNQVMTKHKRYRTCSLRLSNLPGALQIEGCMPRGRYAWGVSYVVSDVPGYARALIKQILHKSAISAKRIKFGAAPENSSLLGAHASPPLSQLVSDMLKKSDNIIAGALFKKLGQLYTKKPGSWKNGSSAVSQILAEHAGVNRRDMRNLDGSGLSHANLTTPAEIMKVLEFAYHHDKTGYEFLTALPIAGVDGTLKHRLANIIRKVRAKTGTIAGVISLAGYAISADNEPLAFVIMINGSKNLGWHYRSIEDKIATVLTRFRR